ncbi:ervatamin-B [Drosophila innubila]|uniref:ervatamin-B n=1 Tax=Drosophila innubila TaxID=198719 RepID=UPI00148C474A|nr:ervatamin-B [Drosophila innubila]
MLKLWLCCALFTGAYAFNHGSDLDDFKEYMNEFEKNYANPTEQNAANYYFNYHTKLIAQQNALEDRKASTYRVKINKFSDIRLITFAARLPQAVYPAKSNDKKPIETENTIADEIDILAEYGINVTAQDQGTLCSGSWAYAAAKALQILNALPSDKEPMEYSAQHLIDCVGMSTSCTTQVPQQAFDYLTQVDDATLLTDIEYPTHENSVQGMCTPPALPSGGVKLATYSKIRDGDDESVKRFVSNSIPVIVEYNPATFGFMHYSSGVYVPPARARAASSQFLVVVGYGHDAATKLDYWLCLNSFGTQWGEDGFIKIVRSDKQPIAKGAIFPNTLG